MIRVLCTGGGTAGHVIPAVPVMQALVADGAEVAFVGSRSGLEERLLEGEAITYYGIASGKLRRYFSWENLWDAFRVLRGVADALAVIRRFRPAVVFSKGGFVSFPVVLAAWLSRVPVVAHESDLSPGLANRMALPFIRTLCVNFPETRPASFRGRVVYTGTPVRQSLVQGDRTRGRAMLGAPDAHPVVLVTGGSLGADAVNRVVRAALPELTRLALVVHVCGPGKRSADDVPGYVQFEYVRDEWGDVLAAADVVVSRAGANTLFELLVLGKPSLLVPLSRRVSRGDQIENAAYAREHGFCLVIDEESLDAPGLVAAVRLLLEEQEQWQRRLAQFDAPDSVALLVREIRAAAGG